MIILKHQLYRNLKRFGVKNLNEQIENKINLPDGNYLATGSGNKYTITDMQGNDTGYEVNPKVEFVALKKMIPLL